MTKYPLCEKAGLNPINNWFKDSECFLDAKDVEAFLEKAPVVYGHIKEGVPNWWGPHENNKFLDTHTARLILIEPIKKEEPRIMNVDEADKLTFSVFGLTPEQIDHLRAFYEAETGKHAHEIGEQKKRTREERLSGILERIVDAADSEEYSRFMLLAGEAKAILSSDD